VSGSEQRQAESAVGFYDRDYFEGGKRESPPHRRELIFPAAARTAAFLRRRLDPGTALDLGCAKGFLVEALRESGVPRAVGLDVSWYAVSAPDGAASGGLAVADIAGAIPVADASCDLVTALDLFEHIAAPLPLLAEIRRVLNPGGAAYLKICHPRHPNARRDPSHVNVRPLSYWKRTFTEAGFRQRRVYESDLSPADEAGAWWKRLLRRFREWAVLGNPADYKFLLWPDRREGKTTG